MKRKEEDQKEIVEYYWEWYEGCWSGMWKIEKIGGLEQKWPNTNSWEESESKEEEEVCS